MLTVSFDDVNRLVFRCLVWRWWWEDGRSGWVDEWMGGIEEQSSVISQQWTVDSSL